MRCEYCNGEWVNEDIFSGDGVTVEILDSTLIITDHTGAFIHINYCPMCGRRLQDVKEVE